jgi:hypothetical protein
MTIPTANCNVSIFRNFNASKPYPAAGAQPAATSAGYIKHAVKLGKFAFAAKGLYFTHQLYLPLGTDIRSAYNTQLNTENPQNADTVFIQDYPNAGQCTAFYVVLAQNNRAGQFLEVYLDRLLPKSGKCIQRGGNGGGYCGSYCGGFPTQWLVQAQVSGGSLSGLGGGSASCTDFTGSQSSPMILAEDSLIIVLPNYVACGWAHTNDPFDTFPMFEWVLAYMIQQPNPNNFPSLNLPNGDGWYIGAPWFSYAGDDSNSDGDVAAPWVPTDTINRVWGYMLPDDFNCTGNNTFNLTQVAGINGGAFLNNCTFPSSVTINPD